MGSRFGEVDPPLPRTVLTTQENKPEGPGYRPFYFAFFVRFVLTTKISAVKVGGSQNF